MHIIDLIIQILSQVLIIKQYIPIIKLGNTFQSAALISCLGHGYSRHMQSLGGRKGMQIYSIYYLKKFSIVLHLYHLSVLC